MHKIIYFKSSNSTFVKIDEDILSRNFITESYFIKNNSQFQYLFSLIKLALYLTSKIKSHNVYFIRFADYHTAIIAFFAKIFNKDLYVVIGGFDATSLPEYNYGVFTSKIRGAFAKYAIKNSTYLLPNNKALILNKNTYIKTKNCINGFKKYVPNINGKIYVINNGYKTSFFQKNAIIKKENRIITVAFINDMRTYYLKGINTFFEAAEQLSNIPFDIVGISKRFLLQNNIHVPNNVTVFEKTTQTELINYYSRAKVFALLSISEGMPNVLFESLLCECIPVISDVNGVPQLLNGKGFVVKKQIISEICENIKKALNESNSEGKQYRQLVIDNYSIERREAAIVELITSNLCC